MSDLHLLKSPPDGTTNNRQWDIGKPIAGQRSCTEPSKQTQAQVSKDVSSTHITSSDINLLDFFL
ncbi:hypothetical protein JHK82_041076 [Glycine max]|uniref:Uncharacterized protein n=1 Tax=Glycine soja TaxID=3848 RepID=A0A445GMC0_GLYSO|nr:hypothetical protein JHK86_041143 [Glycine max]KAG4955367.1 hypothetical protein JHK85_041747 [Glycine max]KAG5104106.1 hypothetical protein JHK82_041076 [Glycine max]KAG5115233.1 hypothetical protein JHK84_041346 [Glycine max]RZB62424.1 hypothetical protein D0Y65_039643 [Glycine soja]